MCGGPGICGPTDVSVVADIDECVEDPDICGPTDVSVVADIDECVEDLTSVVLQTYLLLQK